MKNLSGQVGVYRRPNNTQLQAPLIPLGTTFGFWTVIENDLYKSSKKYTESVCRVSCRCGSKSVIASRKLRAGRAIRCFRCRPRPKRKPATLWNLLFNIYLQRARVTGREFHLSLPQLKFVSLLPCVYCGKEPDNLLRMKYSFDGVRDYSPEMDIHYSGLDRIDSEKGYIHGNVVPCCWECNKIKSALPLDVFLALIARIQKHNPSVEGVLYQAATLFGVS